jgi:uncharacterized spore protein YtfJ
MDLSGGIRRVGGSTEKTKKAAGSAVAGSVAAGDRADARRKRRKAVGAQQLLQSLAERLGGSATVKTVYGEPIAAEGRTIVPVAKVSFGLGGGSGARAPDDPAERSGEEGEGGGGGARAVPVGVVDITREGIRFVPIGGRMHVIGALAAGFYLGLKVARRSFRKAARQV